MSLKPGQVIYRKDHVGKDGDIKNRWFVCGGVYTKNLDKLYVLFYCTGSSLMFPKASTFCATDNSCYTCPANKNEFSKKTHISFDSPALHNSAILCTVIDEEMMNQTCSLKFNFDTSKTLQILKCSLGSKDLARGIKKVVKGEIEHLELFPF